MGNSVRFVIAKEETLASGLELRLQALGALCERFYYSEKGMEKASDTDIRRGQRGPTH